MKEDGEEAGERMITQAAAERAHAVSPKRQIAILSDIHSNLPALEAVLAELARRGVRDFCCLGDIVGTPRSRPNAWNGSRRWAGRW